MHDGEARFAEHADDLGQKEVPLHRDRQPKLGDVAIMTGNTSVERVAPPPASAERDVQAEGDAHVVVDGLDRPVVDEWNVEANTGAEAVVRADAIGPLKGQVRLDLERVVGV